jgi:serine/threonine-protein kinase
VTYSGQVKVVDFGIAKALGSTTKTQTGMIKGKVSYMSPEHACGEPVDRRSDIFSMGVILWEVATGQRLFSGMPDIAVLHRLTSNNVPRPGTVNGAVDERLEAIVMKAMAYEAHDRYQTAGELAKALEGLLYEWGDESSCRDVGALSAARFSDDRERIRALIEQQVQTIQAAPTAEANQLPLLSLEQTTGSGASAIAAAPPPAPAAEPATALTASNTVLTPGITRPSRGAPKGLVLGVLAASAVLGGVAAFYVLSSPADGTDAAASTSEAAPTASVTLRIESEPADADVKCGDRDMGPTPVIESVKAGEEIRCTVSRDGYEPKQLELGKLESDYREKVTLNPVASAEPTGEPSATSVAPRYTAGRPPPPPTTTAPPKTGGGDIRLTR